MNKGIIPLWKTHYACISHLLWYYGSNRNIVARNERNRVFEGEDAELVFTTSPPTPNLAHTQQSDLTLNRKLLPEKDLFSLKKDCKKCYG